MDFSIFYDLEKNTLSNRSFLWPVSHLPYLTEPQYKSEEK